MSETWQTLVVQIIFNHWTTCEHAWSTAGAITELTPRDTILGVQLLADTTRYTNVFQVSDITLGASMVKAVSWQPEGRGDSISWCWDDWSSWPLCWYNLSSAIHFLLTKLCPQYRVCHCSWCPCRLLNLHWRWKSWWCSRCSQTPGWSYGCAWCPCRTCTKGWKCLTLLLLKHWTHPI